MGEEQLRDGGIVQVISASTVVNDSHGTPTAVFMQVKDVTESRQAKPRARLRKSELLAANQELEAFAYSLAHDLRAPLRAIDGFGAALSRRYGDVLEESGRSMLAMRAASTRMRELIDAMLLLSELTRVSSRPRPSISAQWPERSPTSCAHATLAPSRVCDRRSAQTVGDPRLVSVLMVNLLENAWKFTSSCEHPRIEVFRDGADVFAVRDNGAGFDMAFVELLFTPFSRRVCFAASAPAS